MDTTGPLAALVHAAREGEQVAWDAIVDRFLPLVGAIIRRHRLSEADGDDVSQTCGSASWSTSTRCASRTPSPAGSARRRATSASACSPRAAGCRSSIRRKAGASDADTADAIDDELLAAERRQALREALAELPAGRRDLLLLLLTDPPLGYEEISSRLGIPIGSIGPTRARALEQLRRTRALRDA